MATVHQAAYSEACEHILLANLKSIFDAIRRLPGEMRQAIEEELGHMLVSDEDGYRVFRVAFAVARECDDYNRRDRGNGWAPPETF